MFNIIKNKNILSHYCKQLHNISRSSAYMVKMVKFKCYEQKYPNFCSTKNQYKIYRQQQYNNNKTKAKMTTQQQKINEIQIASQEETLEFFRRKYGTKSRKVYAHYSSQFDKIITQQHLMLIPIDERIATRAHGAFDVIYLQKGKLLNLQDHAKRLIKSAASVGIQVQQIKMDYQQIMLKVTSVADAVVKMIENQKKQTRKEVCQNLILGFRLTISSGHGDFGIASLGKKPVFYISVFEPYINYDKQKQGVSEFVTSIVTEIPDKKLVHAKTINYIQNALMANQSKKRGGYQGIKMHQNGLLFEAAVANIAFVFGKQFVTPNFDYVVEGTTIKKLLVYLNILKEQGVIDKISFRDVKIEEVLGANEQDPARVTEMMVIGGDKIVPVLSFNGKKISSEKGPITKKCQKWYEQQMLQGNHVSII